MKNVNGKMGYWNGLRKKTSRNTNIKYNKMIMRIIYINNKATIPIKGGILNGTNK